MANGREYYMYKGYTYCFGFKSRSVTFAQSQRGGRLLVFQGYSYSLQKIQHEVIQWRCTMVQPGTARRCTAKVFTGVHYEIIDHSGRHSHGKPRFIKRNGILVRVY
ncbi:unnamed protein product [Parnassius mnemosyne]|uniref:FLYWCH-type domain-containing protein n=1 Tax=Parnassius mnemosyne TaxID=213953 RepID=A0AAV1K971_9NEOP